MVTLREEYSKHKVEKNEALNEAAIGWVIDNVLILNESFNRESLQRLQQSISKFDSTFAPFAEKVPEIRACLDGAVDLMNSLTMGKNVTKKDRRLQLAKEEKEALKDPATYAVKYMSILYNTLSRFFNKDMRVVLAFPIFKVAVTNPETPLMDLADKDKMKAVLMHAMVPSKEVQPILHRMYRSMDLPSIDYGKIADELLALSVNDFHALMHVEKVPLVVSAEREQPQGSQESSEMLDEEGKLLKEVGELNKQQLQSVIQGLSKIQGIMKAVPELSNLGQNVENLRSQLASTVMQGGLLSGASAKRMAATANIVYTFFDKLGEMWPQIEKLMPEGRGLSEEELNNLQTYMTNAQGGWISKIANFFKSATMPGLSPKEISAEIIKVAQEGQTNPAKAQSAVQSLSSLFQRLNALKLPPSMNPQGQPITPNVAAAEVPQGAGGTAGSAPSAPAGASVAPGGAVGSQANAQGRQTLPGSGPNEQDPKTLANSMASIMGVPPTPTLEQSVAKLLGAGWKITPP